MPFHCTDIIYINIIYTRSERAKRAHSLYVLYLLVCVNGLEEEEHGFDHNMWQSQVENEYYSVFNYLN